MNFLSEYHIIEKNFTELNIRDIQYPMKKKDIPKVKNLNSLNISVFEITSIHDFSIYFNKNCFAEQIDLLFYGNRYCLITNLHKFEGGVQWIHIFVEGV